MAFLPIAAAAVSAVSSISSGFASAANANYQSQVAANDATIANQNADYAEKAGEAQAQAVSLKAARTAGLVKTSQAANNVDVNSGSAVDVQESTREQGNLDTATTFNNALLKAYGYRTQATNFEAQASLDKQEAGQDVVGGFLKAGGSVLGSASQFPGIGAGGGGSGTDLPNTFSTFPTDYSTV